MDYIVIETHASGHVLTNRSNDLQRAKQYAIERAEALLNAGASFRVVVGDSLNPTATYLEIYMKGESPYPWPPSPSPSPSPKQ